jgi:transcriptional antiterminator RfaH
LIADLRQIHNVVKAGVPLTPEARLQPGDRVKVKTGPFAGYEGNVIRREGKTRLLLSLRFLEQGVSMEMDEALLESV